MLVEHEFFESDHSYIVPNRTVISTSDVLQLAGLIDINGIPKAVLDNARHRGIQVDRSIKFFEEAIRDHGEEFALDFIYNQLNDELAEVRLYFEAYRSWKHKVGFETIFPIDQSMVYEIEIDRLIGGTPDLKGTLIDGERRVPAVIDLKCTSRLYGAKLKQKQLAWRMQLQSYSCAIEEDEEFWEIVPYERIRKRILQLNPVFTECGYLEYVADKFDDKLQWTGLCLNAFDKLEAGFFLEKR